MSILNRVAACSIGVVVVLSLAACSNQSTGTTAPNSTAHPSATASATSAPSSLTINSWGPDHTKAGVVFNKQPDGSAALWIRVNHSLSGDEAAVEFNGVLLQGVVADDLVTAKVPADLYAKPGTYKVHVIDRKGEQVMQSNDVKFTVE